MSRDKLDLIYLEMVAWYEAGNGFTFSVPERRFWKMSGWVSDHLTGGWLHTIGDDGARIMIADPLDAARFRAEFGL